MPLLDASERGSERGSEPGDSGDTDRHYSVVRGTIGDQDKIL
jgi:hypothetical protein